MHGYNVLAICYFLVLKYSQLINKQPFLGHNQKGEKYEK
jgi:hypothetical protein